MEVKRLLGAVLAAVQLSASLATHQDIYKQLVAATNAKDIQPILGFVDSAMTDTAVWCDPYPTCYNGKAAIKSFLTGFPPFKQIFNNAGPLVVQNNTGSFYAEAFGWSGIGQVGCLALAPNYATWTLESDGRISSLRWYYDEQYSDSQINRCLATANDDFGDKQPTPILQVFEKLMVALNGPTDDRFLGAADVLASDGIWCDPVPLCSTGPSGARSILQNFQQAAYWVTIRPQGLMQAGNATVATAMTTVSIALRPDGCISATQQFMTIRLSKTEPGKASEINWIYDASDIKC
eukprot:TRINITY_DN41045_c0_g1_i1.p2 TRINITY_DN41045_c0_g1~~TRINITY_DN41045_c0_g1_i1.p2  ORF type:complete len:293 (-),score=50.27 TRINITY_DN41045_c0_g1_i1:68-946(-)